MVKHKQRVALFGGSFNPPHISHQMICFYLLYYKKFNTVHLIPTYKHPFNKELISFEHRLEMCQLLRRPFRYDVVANDIERELVTSGASQGHTIDTIKALIKKQHYVDYTLVVGSDITHEWDKWKDFDKIQKLVDILVLTRRGYPVKGKIRFATFEMPEVSSTELRKLMSTGKSVADFVYPPVLDYIKQTGLYI